MRPQIFAFFAGAGFLDLGFETSGFDIVFVNEIRPSFLKAYQYSRERLGISQPRFGYSANSINDFLASPLLNVDLSEKVLAAKESGEPVGFIGGPPCPDFSVGGKNRGREGENGKLSSSYVDLICEQRPDFFLFENVKGLWRTKRHRAFFEELKAKLHEAGYKTTEKLINSISYGVPQDRERIILIGLRNDFVCEEYVTEAVAAFPWNSNVKFPAHVISKVKWPGAEPYTSDTRPMPADIPEILTVEHWFRKNNVEKHPNAIHKFTPHAGLARFQTVAEGDDSRKSYKRLHRWRYSPTACYGNNEVHIHPYLPRRISVAEALAIQSLPREFELPGNISLSDMFKTVGNGVPYLAARGIALSMLNMLSGHYDKTDSIGYSARNIPIAQESGLQLHQP